MNKIYTFYSLLACVILSIGNANAWTFTWNGSTDNDWSNSANWTRSGTNTGSQTVPNSSDNVVINGSGGGNQPTLIADVTLVNLTVSGGILDLNEFTITATTAASFTGGTVLEGNITAASFSSMQNTTFTGLMIITKTGSTSNSVAGGNTFNGPLAILNNSTGLFRLANTTADNHTGFLHYEEQSTGQLEPAYSGNNNYSGDLSSQGSTNTVTFSPSGGSGRVVITSNTTIYGTPVLNKLRVNSTGTLYFQDDMVITELNLISGGIHLNDNTLRVTDQTSLQGGTIQYGVLEVFDLVDMESTTFLSPFSLNKVGGPNNDVDGGNTFGDGTMSVINSSASRLRLASINADEYEGGITFQENGSGQLEPAYNGSNIFMGDISTIGSSSVVSFAGGTGAVEISGDNTQHLVGAAAQTPIIKKLVMNTSGTLILNGVPLNISTNLTLTEGMINSTSSDILILSDGVTITGVSNTSHVIGPIRKVGNDAFTFPTGDGSFYAPISISAPGNLTDHFTASYFGTAYADLSVVSGLDHVSTEEYWILDRTNGLSNVQVTLSHNASQRSGPVTTLGDLRVARYNGADWESTGNATTTGTVGGGTVRSNSVVTDFSPFTLGSTSTLNPLPISLINFNALALNDNVLVKWTTSNESNNDFFTVEKSLDGKNWMNIGVVNGAENSNTTLNYQLLDMAPVEGIQYYRLKQTDLDGQVAHSAIVPVRFSSENNTKVVLYPQPAGNTLNVNLQNSENENANITVYSAMGQKMLEINNLSGNYFQLDLSSLATGVYYMELNLDGEISKTKLIKQ